MGGGGEVHTGPRETHAPTDTEGRGRAGTGAQRAGGTPGPSPQSPFPPFLPCGRNIACLYFTAKLRVLLSAPAPRPARFLRSWFSPCFRPAPRPARRPPPRGPDPLSVAVSYLLRRICSLNILLYFTLRSCSVSGMYVPPFGLACVGVFAPKGMCPGLSVPGKAGPELLRLPPLARHSPLGWPCRAQRAEVM